MSPAPDVTQLLQAYAGGDRAALDRLLPAVYDEIRQLAHRQLRGERDGMTLTTTDLAHEAYARLVDATRADWQSRAHFFAVVATAMRHILVDRARARRTQKRGGGEAPISLAVLDEEGAGGYGPVAAEQRDEVVLALDEQLVRLAAHSERAARVVECRYFAGLSLEETAEALGVSVTTVKNEWRLARAWLHREMRDDLA
jgi:RNA polymerase sigma factor (TIGR02999 family)